MIKINTPEPPARTALPTDPMAAWANGYRLCATLFEDAIEQALPKMDMQAKAALLNSIGQRVGQYEGRSARSHRPLQRLSCGHPVKYVEQMEAGAQICTLCGTTSEMSA